MLSPFPNGTGTQYSDSTCHIQMAAIAAVITISDSDVGVLHSLIFKWERPTHIGFLRFNFLSHCVALCSFSHFTLKLLPCTWPCGIQREQHSLNSELPRNTSTGCSETVCRSHANKPMALLTNMIHLMRLFGKKKNLMETPAMNTVRIVPLVVFHPFCFCYKLKLGEVKSSCETINNSLRIKTVTIEFI